jgi:hypothetical protein
MENLQMNAVLFLELKLMKDVGLDSEDFELKYGAYFKAAYLIQEEQIRESWSVGYQQSLADDKRNKQVSDFLDFDHYIKATYGSI